MTGLLILGAGGHGKVLADTASSTGCWNKIAFLDDRYPAISSVLSWPVLGTFRQAAAFLGEYSELTVAVGDNPLRVRLLRQFAGSGFGLPVIIHPTAFVSKGAVLEAGSVIFAQAAVNTGAKIGIGSIINTGATVDHDCVLGDGVHISPGVHLAGEVDVGNYSWLGIGAAVIQQISIGKNAVIGAGTVVIADVPANATVAGVPGRVVKKNDGIK